MKAMKARTRTSSALHCSKKSGPLRLATGGRILPSLVLVPSTPASVVVEQEKAGVERREEKDGAMLGDGSCTAFGSWVAKGEEHTTVGTEFVRGLSLFNNPFT